MTFRLWSAIAGFVAFLMLAAAPAKAEWRRAESPNFVIYGNVSESQLRERILLLEDYDRLLRLLTSVNEPPAPNKFHIYILAGPAELRLVDSVPPGIAGFYAATVDGTAAFIDGRAAAEGNNILFHEYAHHFMRQTTSNAYPAWYVEGFAEYFATVRFTARKIDIGNFAAGRAASLLQGEWVPMERMLTDGPFGLGRDAMAHYYAQSWLLVHYFYSTPERQAALARLLSALRRGEPAQALQSATGFTPQTLTEELRRYIRGGTISYRQMNRTSVEAPPVVTVTAMPRSTGDLIAFEGALRIGIKAENQQPYLLRIREAAARYPDDPLAMRVLAHAELLHGDCAAADRLLDRLLAAAPNDAELLYFKGMRYLVAAESDDPPEGAAATARSWFTRAHAADPNHYQTLFRFAQSLRGEDNYVSENTSNALNLAHRLAPQVPTITMNAAIMRMNLGDYAGAEAMLRPLAVNPHNQSLARAAQRLIEQVRERAARPARRPQEEAEEPAEAQD